MVRSNSRIDACFFCVCCSTPITLPYRFCLPSVRFCLTLNFFIMNSSTITSKLLLTAFLYLFVQSAYCFTNAIGTAEAAKNIPATAFVIDLSEILLLLFFITGGTYRLVNTFRHPQKIPQPNFRKRSPISRAATPNCRKNDCDPKIGNQPRIGSGCLTAPEKI